MRIAQITDVHLRARLPGTSPVSVRRSRLGPQLLAEAVADAAARGAEVVALTGDLLDVPGEPHDPADVAADYQLCQSLLANAGLPYLVVPGNHDDYPAMAAVFSQPRVRDIGGYRFVNFSDREHEHNVPRRVDADQSLFEEALGDVDGPPQVHLQHFLITPQIEAAYPYNYRERREMLKKIVECGRVRLVLSGHYHPGTELIRHAETYFATGPALCESPHPYRMYDVDGPGVTMREYIVRPSKF